MKAHHTNMQVKVFVSEALDDLEMKKQIRRILEAETEKNDWLNHSLKDFNVKLVRLDRASKVAYLSKTQCPPGGTLIYIVKLAKIKWI